MAAAWRLLPALLLVLEASSQGLLEVSMEGVTSLWLNSSTPMAIHLQNIPANISFVIFQVHSQYVNITLSYTQIPTRITSKVGSDDGLLSPLQAGQSEVTWYMETSSPSPVLVSAVTVPYSERDPVPGACNLEFNLEIDPNVYLQYNLYETVIKFAPANLGYARGASPAECDVQPGQDNRWRLQYDIYQYFLPENSLNESVLISHLQRMALPPQVIANGKKLVTLSSNDRTTMSFSSIPGQGVIYNVIVRDPVLNTSAAYVPVHTYACNFTATMDNCYTLGSVSTKVFFTFCAIYGLFVCFFGHRYLKTGFFFVGFVIFGFLIFVLLTRVASELLDYGYRLALTAIIGIIGGLLLVGFWWRFGTVYLCMILVGLELGFLVSSIVFFTPIGDFSTFHSDVVFWLSFTCIALIAPMCLLPFPRVLNILACSIVGSYTVVLAIDCYLYTSLSYITLNVLKRALNSDFSTAYTSVPLQTNDFIIITVWALLAVSGAIIQFRREREQPHFPPTPYTVWKRDRDRRITNILDPSYHTPPLKDRILASLAQFRDYFRKGENLGERTPLLL